MRVETTEAHAPSGSAPQQEQPAQREVRCAASVQPQRPSAAKKYVIFQKETE